MRAVSIPKSLHPLTLILALPCAFACSSDVNNLDLPDAQVRDTGPADIGVPQDMGTPQEPELSVSFLEATASQLALGEGFDVRLSAMNSGALAQAVIVRASVCKMPCERTEAIRLGEIVLDSLEAGDTVEGIIEAQVPSGIEGGAYVLYAEIDPNHRIDELDEGNNRTELRDVTILGLSVRPGQMDLGRVPAGCARQAPVTIHNVGDGQIVISEAAIASGQDSFQLLSASLPARLMPGAQLEVTVRYAPQIEGAHEGTLQLLHDQGEVPLVVALVAEATEAEVTTERFSQLASPAIDVLFVVDDTSSAHLTSLGAQYGPMLEGAAEDLQVGIVTANGEGVLVGDTFLTSSRPGLAQSFSDLLAQIQPSGQTNQGLQVVNQALALRDNAAFFRRDAALAVVFVSGVDDRSPRPESFYVDELRDLKGGVSRVVINAVTSGARYTTAATLGSGVQVSDADADWSLALSDFGGETFGLQDHFYLSGAPPRETIEVLVDGAELSAISPERTVNWSYDTEAAAVVFEGVVPAPLAEVEISYNDGCR